jgi:hypothetical protein|tara:strand:- start:438 stop:683 length:246 start_codon:yes stop_codon:yes gene_type:complete
MQNEIADMIAEAQKSYSDRQKMKIDRFIKSARRYLNSDEEVEDFKNTPQSMQLMIMWQIEEIEEMSDQIDRIRTHLEETPV